MVNGENDSVAPKKDVAKLVERLKLQKGIVITHTVIPGANHFFENHVDELLGITNTYLDKRLGPVQQK
jgi:alpha/beta superfamily hydrolase